MLSICDPNIKELLSILLSKEFRASHVTSVLSGEWRRALVDGPTHGGRDAAGAGENLTPVPFRLPGDTAGMHVVLELLRPAYDCPAPGHTTALVFCWQAVAGTGYCTDVSVRAIS